MGARARAGIPPRTYARRPRARPRSPCRGGSRSSLSNSRHREKIGPRAKGRSGAGTCERGSEVLSWRRVWYLRNIFAAFDAAHQPLELLRGFGAKISVVHSTKLFGDCKQSLRPQTNNVLLVIFVVRNGHLGLA